ncbi:MAG: transglycosylase SLT domain-containing protein [Patescibacteria group bacterium]|nr:transglycosylase SLT domain-containing protein [Patescibacteria group bacterium]
MKPFNDSVPTLSLEKLKEIKAKLIAKREALKKELQTKYPEAYKWLVDRNIDLNNLQKYSKNIAAALALTNQLLIQSPPLVPLVPVPTPPKTDKDQDSTNPEISDEEKAKRTWQLYGDLIEKVAKKYNLDPQLIFATIMTESEGNPKAYRFESHLGDASYGLGQILYSTAQGLGFTGSAEDIYRPEIAIDLIGKYHKNTIDTYGLLTPEQMTVVYNTGELFGYPTYGHLARFREWYYSYKKDLSSDKVT